MDSDKKIHRLKRKRIWPSITLFVVFIILCAFLVTFLAQFFAIYIIESKLEVLYEKTLQADRSLAELLEEDYTLPEAVETVSSQLQMEESIYVLDSHAQPVGSTSASIPDLDGAAGYLNTFLNEKIVLRQDSEKPFIQTSGIGSLFGVSLKEVFDRSNPQDFDENDDREWLKETVFTPVCWMQAPSGDKDYTLYMKHTMQIKRQDVLYTYLFCALIIVLLLIPIVFLFVNTIGAIATQRKITRLLYLEHVTGGRNWFYFQNQAKHILSKYRNRKKAFAIVNLHLERYHNYCACHGVKMGEELLKSMDSFLSARTLREECQARYEGADFGLLLVCPGQNSQEYIEHCTTKVRSLLAELTGIKPEQKIHFHAGVCMIEPVLSEKQNRYARRKNIDIDQIYHYANTATRSTKCKEEQRISFFDRDMLEDQLWERKVEERMEDALNGQEFTVYLQPKYTPSDAKLVGAEALVRWISPTEGFIPPNRFIPIFEENGFITRLDDYMISQVARLQAEWIIQGKKIVPVSVNISRAHFSQEGLAEHICQLVDAYGVKHELIELEVTESAFLEDKEILIDTVKQLKAYGFHVSMDDFGSGYSSLNSLKDMPLDVLKLDMEFFRGEGDKERREIIVREAINLARGLNMHVVAEGIEKKEQVDFLTGLGCDMIQGFYFAKPMPVAEFVEKVEKDA